MLSAPPSCGLSDFFAFSANGLTRPDDKVVRAVEEPNLLDVCSIASDVLILTREKQTAASLSELAQERGRNPHG